jgi:hypothetical protein
MTNKAIALELYRVAREARRTAGLMKVGSGARTALENAADGIYRRAKFWDLGEHDDPAVSRSAEDVLRDPTDKVIAAIAWAREQLGAYGDGLRVNSTAVALIAESLLRQGAFPNVRPGGLVDAADWDSAEDAVYDDVEDIELRVARRRELSDGE